MKGHLRTPPYYPCPAGAGKRNGRAAGGGRRPTACRQDCAGWHDGHGGGLGREPTRRTGGPHSSAAPSASRYFPTPPSACCARWPGDGATGRMARGSCARLRSAATTRCSTRRSAASCVTRRGLTRLLSDAADALDVPLFAAGGEAGDGAAGGDRGACPVEAAHRRKGAPRRQIALCESAPGQCRPSSDTPVRDPVQSEENSHAPLAPERTIIGAAAPSWPESVQSVVWHCNAV